MPPETTECHIHGVQPAVKVTYWRRDKRGEDYQPIVIWDCEACQLEWAAEIEEVEENLRKRGLLPPEGGQ